MGGHLSTGMMRRRLMATSGTSVKSVTEAPVDTPVFVNSYFVANMIDVDKVNIDSIKKPLAKDFLAKSVTLTLNPAKHQYVTVFKFGGVVLFNIPEQEHMDYINAVRKSSTTNAFENIVHTESYKVLIHPNLEKPSAIKSTHVNIAALDLNNVVIVATVMAQSVAFDYYSDCLQQMLEQFMAMNQRIHHAGRVSDLNPMQLHKMIAATNILMSSVLSKVSCD